MVSLRCAKRSLFCAGARSFSVVDVFLTMLLLCRDSTESTLQAGTYGRRHHQKEEEEALR